MEVLIELWDKTTDALSAISENVSEGLVRLFGSSNERRIRHMRPLVARINELEPSMQALSDDQLKAKTEEFRGRRQAGESLDDLLPEAFAACREAGRRFLNMRHFDVQLMGGMVLHSGDIAEMITGEGKTLVSTLASYLNALDGKGVHVVTVNDYLARRDAEWMSPLFQGLGMTVGAIQSEMEASERQATYACDVTYGTNNEFGFDYLRDNMKPTKDYQAQGELHYAIIDEVDSILIDEARTPLIISGPAFDDVRKYAEADRIARLLKRDAHFEVKEKERTCHLNDEGVREAEKIAGVESFYTPGNMEWPHLIDNSLKAHHLYRRDRDYVVQPNGEVVIVDEFTGRLMVGRQWSDGLHQAVEAKERVKIKEENQTLATITLQNFFKLYKKLSGMTGTAMTEANEFYKVYGLDVIAIPTNRGLSRVNYPDVIFRFEREKNKAMLDEIKEVHETGRPILVGTVSIEKSEELSEYLTRYGIPHQVLNAKYHEREAEIVAQAGRKAAVTIATNMAGRGTDIILGGNPEFMAWSDLKRATNEDGRIIYETRLDVPKQVWLDAVGKYEPEMKAEGREVAVNGGLHIIGTERHESRRIDNQLRGRSGRQGDPGSSRFFLSLDDDLMRKFAGDWVSAVLTRLGMQEGEAIESKMVSRRIEGAQKKVEERNFDIRKNLLEYDEVMDEQRKRVYSFRQSLLEGESPKDRILEMIDSQVQDAAGRFLADDYGAASFAEWVSQRLNVDVPARDFKGVAFEDAGEVVRGRGERQLYETIREAMDENLPSDAEPEDWTWVAFVNWFNKRFELDVKEKELRRFEERDGDETRLNRGELEDFLHGKAKESIDKLDLTPAKEFLESDWGRRSLAGWVHHKFGLAVDPETWQGLGRVEIVRQLRDKAREHYAVKESELPVRIAVTRFLGERSQSQTPRYDREGLAAWASERFHSIVDADELRPLLRPEIESHLIELAHKHYQGAKLAADLDARLDAAFPKGSGREKLPLPADQNALAELSSWARQNLGVESTPQEFAQMPPAEVRSLLVAAVDAKARPEMREMEKVLLLQILDSSWMEHLRAMDHLRSSIGLQGYAQIDPKVEYKREGMRIFGEMWNGIADRVTDLIFRVEHFDPEFLSYLGSRWKLDRAQTIHESADSQLAAVPDGGGVRQSQDAAIQSSQQASDKRKEPVRNVGKKVGRNDPCPCGSGKKFKACHMRNQPAADDF
ncbi:MAG: preprotein translocase subunit SecA [Paludisphaera borealis]|uniref:preprotein translocase subunit SecA n=1 Tax=Paludisphaera borealis TaxID=1387353 RepID=UPI002849914B|nr:preprotein translocase subunit SecA [Paludisphaera borealis]MDR3621821.1 preprotein translocase subunit SecA [Paludisphaera borealis]